VARKSVAAGFDWQLPTEAPSPGNPLADHPRLHLQLVFRDFVKTIFFIRNDQFTHAVQRRITMIHNGKHVWTDPAEGEVSELVCLAVSAAAFILADPAEGESDPLAQTIDLKSLKRYIRNGNEVFMLAHADRECSLHFEPTPDKPGEFDLNTELYEGDPSRLLNLAVEMLGVFDREALAMIAGDEIELRPEDLEIVED